MLNTISKIRTKLIFSLKYSIAGFRDAFRLESSFRYECFILLISIIALQFIDLSLAKKAILVLSMLFVMVVELLNTGIEKVVDSISNNEKKEIYRIIKDCGSAAVFLSIIICCCIWVILLN